MAENLRGRLSVDACLAVRERHESIVSARRTLARSEARVRGASEQLVRTNLLLEHLKRMLTVSRSQPRAWRHAPPDR